MRKPKAGLIALALLGIALPSCRPATPAVDWSTRDEIPPEHLAAVMDAHYRGLGAMERYEYARASAAFGEAHARAPGWVVGSINLAIAMLNQGGEQENKLKAEGQEKATGESKQNIDEAARLLTEVIARQPDNPWAHFSRGIIYQDQSRRDEANKDFEKVTQIDPGDANAWLEYGSTLEAGEQEDPEVRRERATRQAACFVKALECNPYLTTATYKLSTARRDSGDLAARKKLIVEFMRSDPDKNPASSGELAKLVYGEMGRYARVIDPFTRPKAPEKVAPPPRFEVPSELLVALPPEHHWATAADFVGPLAVVGRARARFGQGVAVFDFDRDGLPDLYLTAALVGPKGVRDVLLRNLGDNKFDATDAFGLPDDRAGLGVAAGDFDGDRRIDLYLTGVGDDRLYRNTGQGFEDVTRLAGLDASGAISLTARWLDLDQDGDLDLYVIRHAPASASEAAFTGVEVPGLAVAAYRNDGKPAVVEPRPETNWAPLAMAPPDLLATKGLSIAFSTEFPGLEALKAGIHPHTAVAALDLDDDRDVDLVVSADGRSPLAILNDRAGAFHVEPLDGLHPDGPIGGLLVVDLDKDGRPDLVAVGPGGRVSAWRNASTRRGGVAKLAWEATPVDARGWRAAQAVDLDLDTWPDLVGLPAPGLAPGPAWTRNAGARLEASPLPLAPDGSEKAPLVGLAVADLAGDALPDAILVRDGLPPRVARNLGNGNHWLAVDLAGRWKFSYDRMRTNSEGLGARLSLEGQGINVPHDHTTQAAGLGQSVGPVVLGMGSSPSAPLLRVRWPDGVIQCELNVTADKTFVLAEQSRKTGSCPVLFTWNGAKFECLGDFLGGGGLGYLVAPGVYGQPDRDESVAIAPGQLRAVEGTFRLSVVEPMDEVAYLDKLTLEVIDRPPGVSSTPDERFAPEGPRPTGETIAWSRTIEPARATDHAGRDVAAEIRAWDRRTVDRFRLSGTWTGYAEDHSLVLDFADRLAGLPADRKVVLCLAGWVEYPYSQTNYAAATAGVSLKPPVLERRQPDGSWRVIDPHPGYPAGLPRMMTVDLTGKLAGPDCVIRLSTNMECYYDQAFLALPDPPDRVRTTTLPVARAELRDRGYLREVSPDGRLPLLYEYDYVDPAPLARMQGSLTRHGDIAPLLAGDDDRSCTVGPGDEARLEFDAKGLPDLPEGWTRSFVLKAVGYCKDADPFTAGSDAVGPLPWRGMPPYPFEPGVERPRDPAYSAYLRDYQTRPAGVR